MSEVVKLTAGQRKALLHLASLEGCLCRCDGRAGHSLVGKGFADRHYENSLQCWFFRITPAGRAALQREDTK